MLLATNMLFSIIVSSSCYKKKFTHLIMVAFETSSFQWKGILFTGLQSYYVTDNNSIQATSHTTWDLFLICLSGLRRPISVHFINLFVAWFSSPNGEIIVIWHETPPLQMY